MNIPSPRTREPRPSGRRGAPSLAAVALLVLAGGHASGEAPGRSGPLSSRARRPVALAYSPDGTRLLVANARSGSLSVLDPAAARVVAEHQVGVGLDDLASLPGGRLLLAVDRPADVLLLLEVQRDSARVVERLGVAPDPVAVVVAPDGGSCVVASTASRRLTFVSVSSPDREGTGRLSVVRSLDLPFSPRDLALADAEARVVVADAFGGKLAVVDRARGVLDSVRTLPAHNIRGLAVTPDGRTLVVAHLTLHSRAWADFEDVHWGRLLGSHLRSLRMDAVLAPGSDDDLLRGGCVIDLGAANDGVGDPAALACGRSGAVAVALGGVDQVALGRSPSGHFRRFGVGRRPSALAPDGKTVCVADTLDETISVVEVATGRRIQVIDLGPRPELTSAERGERLFSDARLSHDGWMSCQSCHTDGQGNGQAADTLGDGSYGAPKLVPSLLGTGATGPWSWTGAVDRLEDQVRKSIRMTMRNPTPSGEQVEALTAYLRSLPPPRPLAPAEDAASVARGRAAFRSRGCAACHAPPEYTTPGRYDVGLADEAGNRRFNPPSLRGVGRRGPLLHDGRAATLPAVLLEHRHLRAAEMTLGEVADLVAFLDTL